MLVTPEDVAKVAATKYGDLGTGGWGPRLRSRFGYYTPDDWYEAVLDGLVARETEWLEVGCGRDILSSSPLGSRRLADRCRRLTGIDPSENINENPYVHRRERCALQDFTTTDTFDLITLRMVAEHVTDPESAVAALSRLCSTGGQVLIYTVDKYSPASLAAAVTPMQFHHRVKRILWQTQEKDTFPTAYRMNTRNQLRQFMEGGGFVEEGFMRLADTRTTNRFRLLNVMELSLWRGLRAFGLNYPENCLLGLYRKR
jgi:2-polyprenyl-3-methyl-5-hydroxy-6-metoxy-1,4-benzoquinol methylase